MLHSFHVALFSYHTLFNFGYFFHFCSCCTFSCFTSFVLYFFCVALSSCCTFFMFCYFHVALFSYWTLFMLHSIHDCSFPMLYYFYVTLSRCFFALHSFHVALLCVNFLQNRFSTENLEWLPLIHALWRSCNLEILLNHLLANTVAPLFNFSSNIQMECFCFATMLL